MNNYELTVVLPGGATSAKKKNVLGRIEKLIKTGKGKITETNDWGKLDLAYEIEKQNEGVFLLLNVETDAQGIKNLKDKLRLDDDIIRYLIIREDRKA
jgi:small subunit ribosomal protein S6